MLISVFNPAIRNYIVRLLHSVPVEFYIGALALFLICICSFFALAKTKKAARLSLIVLLAEYICFLLCSTVFFRNDVRLIGYNYKPFRSYVDYLGGSADYLLPQVIMNIIVFIPIGFLLSLLFQNLKWWQLLIIGGVFSITIEILQLTFQKGFCEVDDILHNLFGCLMGILFYKSIKFICKQLIYDGKREQNSIDGCK